MNRFRSTFALASATQYLILASVLVYAIQILQQPKGGSGIFDLFNIRITWFEATFGLITPPQFPDVFWQLVTYMFLHGALWHILFNMYVLWLFGHALERVWGMRYFLTYYFFTGIGAGLTTVVVAIITGQDYYSVSVGASGAIYGVFLAFGMLFPNQPLFLLFIPVPIPAKYAVMILGGFALFASITGFLPLIGHITHLGGIIFGLIFLKGRGWWVRLRDLYR
jgi:membrane associated rhomboid family serine protease